MSEMQIGYGSEWQLYRMLGRHRKLCNATVRQVLNQEGAIPKRGDFDSTIRSLPATTSDKRVEDPRSAFNFAGKIHLLTTVSGESSVSENLAPDALEN